MRMKLTSKNRGMLLIEVMISVAILSILSLSTARMLFQAYKDKLRIEREIEVESYIGSIKSLIFKDISMAFHYQDINTDIYNKVQKKRLNALRDKIKKAEKRGDKEEALKYEKKASSIFTRSTKKLTHFVGKKESLYFTSHHHARTIKDSPVSDLIEIGYFLKSCKGKKENKDFKSCLWRSVSYVLDDDLEKGGKKRILIEGVKKVQFSYNKEGDSMDQDSNWKEEWRSDYLGKAIVRGKFPKLVKVFIEFQNQRLKKGKTQTLNFIVPIAFPNHQVKENSTGRR